MLWPKLPKVSGEGDRSLKTSATLGRLFRNKRYLEGVVAQAFYVGAQIMCWTFIIQYGVNELKLSKADAQGYNIIAMVIFVSSRFICTYLLKLLQPGQAALRAGHWRGPADAGAPFS